MEQEDKQKQKEELGQLTQKGATTMLLVVLLFIVFASLYYYDTQKTDKMVAETRAEIKKNEQKRDGYLKNGADVRNNSIARAQLDSLSGANWHLFNVAAEKYFDRIDKKYTLAKFFNTRQISELNKILAPYMEDLAGNSSFEYKFIKTNLPLRANTTLNTLLDIIGILNVSGTELENVGVVANNGYVCMFKDQGRQDLFDEFANDSYAGMMGNDGPNFEIREFAKIRNEYTRNTQKIDSISRVVHHGDSVINAYLMRLDAERDSLNQVLKGAVRGL